MKRVGLLAGLLVLLLGYGVVAQEPSPGPPPFFGGRVEMPEHGFAVTFPEDWVAYDTGADVDGQVEVTQARVTGLPTAVSTDLRSKIPYAQAQGVRLLAIEFSEHLVDPQICSFGVVPDFAALLDEASMDLMFLEYANMESVTDVEGPMPVELPVGSGWAFALTNQRDDQLALTYFVKAGDDGLLVTCTGSERPDDDWLSIAETIELLPAEE